MNFQSITCAGGFVPLQIALIIENNHFIWIWHCFQTTPKIPMK
jgi:hypothetical protein